GRVLPGTHRGAHPIASTVTRYGPEVLPNPVTRTVTSSPAGTVRRTWASREVARSTSSLRASSTPPAPTTVTTGSRVVRPDTVMVTSPPVPVKGCDAPALGAAISPPT